MNLYAYVGNDPVNAMDPTGEKSYLIARTFPLAGGRRYSHMYVIVVDDQTGEVTRFSYGPQRRNQLRPGKLVSITGSSDPTDLADAAGAALFLADSEAAAKAGINGVEINASDEAVLASGAAVDSALGTKQNPGSISYDARPWSGTRGGNSNSGAYAVANGANPDAEQARPRRRLQGTRFPTSW